VKKISNQSGYTLLELIIVLLAIAILVVLFIWLKNT